MNADLILSNLLNPPILFFFLGALAAFLRSDLDIPQPIPKLLSLYLLLAIGFRGGVELHHSGLDNNVLYALSVAIGMALLVPLYSWFILRRKLDPSNAAAIAATYGSVSAVTFIAATAYLSKLGVEYGGHMVAAMALMESPAIVVGVMLAGQRNKNKTEKRTDQQESRRRKLLRESFLNGSVFVLIGSLLIGLVTGSAGEEALSPFTDDVFKGVLSLFLLDMGLVSAQRLGDLKKLGAFPIMFALLLPVCNGIVGILLGTLGGLSNGDTLLLSVLCAGASYIAVPAAMRMAVPDASPGLYVTMALGLTFPLNVVVGIPFYMFIIQILN